LLHRLLLGNRAAGRLSLYRLNPPHHEKAHLFSQAGKLVFVIERIDDQPQLFRAAVRIVLIRFIS
jgi:hypothetical protein